MLYGISGKIGTGKDLVGSIIQYLETVDDSTPEEFMWRHVDRGDPLIQPKYEIKKFADAIKDIVCIMIGCTREQLEDREFKEKELGEGWELIRTTSSYGAPDEIRLPDSIQWVHDIRETLTPRKILQLLGTECGRQVIHPNIWVNALFSKYNGDKNWIITDVRFPNELEAIKKRGGITIRINRKTEESGEHSSETALDNAEFDHVIENDGVIEELIEKVKGILYICNPQN